jgi:dTDP-4-dehydrorhamnose 3,5-epimerase
MHLHRRHDEFFYLLTGRAWIGLRDVRPGSPTEGRSCLIGLRADDPATVSFPRGILHGWCFPEPSVHVQATSETYAIYAGDDNLGCHWSDPALEIPWPMRPTEVSARADAFPALAALLDQTLRIDPDFAY